MGQNVLMSSTPIEHTEIVKFSLISLILGLFKNVINLKICWLGRNQKGRGVQTFALDRMQRSHLNGKGTSRTCVLHNQMYHY